VSRLEQRVQIFSIGLPKEGTPRDRRRYRVRWRIDGQDKTRSLKTKAQAERLQTQLQMAIIDGEDFDLATGLPASWVKKDTTWWEWSREWLGLKCVNAGRKLTPWHRLNVDPPGRVGGHVASSVGTLPRSRSLSR
jgi:hypothetical protein